MSLMPKPVPAVPAVPTPAPVKRKQTAEQALRTEAEQLSRMNINSAGVDIGSQSHFVAVPPGRDTETVREFSAFTCDLNRMADWLQQCGVDTVAMESTGVYWIPVFELLESRGFKVMLVNAHHVHNVPGRKTDVQDCQWLQQLHTYGLLRGSFRPPEDICALRAYLRQRENLTVYAGSHIQHMQKAMNQMNIHLHHVVTDITGVTGMRIIHAILDGERAPCVLAEMRDRRCKNTVETIRKSLEGNWCGEHLFELRQAVDLFEFYQGKIADCDREIESLLDRFDSETEEAPPEKDKRKHGKPRNEPAFDARAHLFRICGVDLTRIDGIDAHSALKIIAETGTDMGSWKSAKHFASWLGLCPGNKISGGKILSGKTKPAANKAAAAFRLAANGLHRSQSALGAFLRRQKARLGAPKAITATAHKLAVIFYSMLKNGTEYTDAGQDQYEKQHRERVL
ncbi:MAG: IS110 family transposase, partial [Gammaproteobacteria bacterium]|nr:IS110 family transposase [Gammaproteobacteria bacterium]